LIVYWLLRKYEGNPTNILDEYIISKADVHYQSVGNPPALPAGRLSASGVDPLQSGMFELNIIPSPGFGPANAAPRPAHARPDPAACLSPRIAHLSPLASNFGIKLGYPVSSRTHPPVHAIGATARINYVFRSDADDGRRTTGSPWRHLSLDQTDR
jgi:hypothetical protein